MLPQNYVLPARARLEILLVLAFACNSEAASGDSPISSSSDVWATLVANIAPLLVLVGEKHVKAYFKNMCRPSHHLLFASAPIGLVTAVTTLIRLNGTPVLKRMIGRQFETRAEVLADVTSVSGGEVGLELRNMNLEQTIQPTDEDLAMFWVHGRTEGSPEEVAKTFTGWVGTLMGIGYAAANSASLYYDRRCSWEMMMSFKATGTCARWVARGHAAESRNLPELSGQCEKKVVAEKNSGDIATCTASAAVYARFTDVSLGLTASVNLDDGKLEIVRYAIIVLCSMGNVGIILAAWFRGRDPRDVGLVGAGLFVSCAGSWLTAWLVDEASEETILDMSQLSAIASGFFSDRIPEGTELSFCPKKIAISTDARPGMRGGVAKVRGWMSTVAVVAMVLAYTGLYLGLRSSDWWVSLAMLGNAAIAGIARSIVVPTALYLNSADRRLPNPMTCAIGYSANREDLSHPDKSNNGSLDIRAGSAPGQDQRVLSEPLDVGLYEAVVGEYRYKGGSRAYDNIQPYIWTALALATEMSKRGIAPLEMRDFPPRSAGIIGVEGAACIFSDIITRKGVWRQPLEVIVHPGGQSVPERVLAIFWGWYWRASAHQAQKVASIELPPDLLNRFIDLGDDDGDDDAKFGTPTDKLKEVLNSSTTPREILWMGAKLCYASCHTWDSNAFEEAGMTWFGGATHQYFRQGQILSFLDAIVAAGLTCPRA
ncbi:unnamed protein product [Tuber melanosporum]|uniref:(Perigord truffle) hypothetical protein n=1 Tax=Tuber melanosporum (strain Mel28) TaxID=656061 RepID=D5G468_TUBMM|nr:uncharacterized protein GSTUM_00003971001 [Tuber melanosporum]CAZ79311.1 unnamed protein product [Tuber melanosporum]